MTTKNAIEGDWVRVSYEGELHWGVGMTLHLKQERGELQLPLGYEEITKIDKPVKVNDVITHEQIRVLPSGSIVVGMDNGKPYEVIGSTLFYGIEPLRPSVVKSQNFRVLDIKEIS